jgi:hypothetical protein
MVESAPSGGRGSGHLFVQGTAVECGGGGRLEKTDMDILLGLACVFLAVGGIVGGVFVCWLIVVAWRFAWRRALESNSTGDFFENVGRSMYDGFPPQLGYPDVILYIVSIPVYLLLCIVMLIRLLCGVGGEVTSRNIVGSILGVVVAVPIVLIISIPGIMCLSGIFQGNVSMWWFLLPSGLVICGGIAGFSYP